MTDLKSTLVNHYWTSEYWCSEASFVLCVLQT